ncbi:MAG: hypothetical protein BGN82_06215, partial [Alphaproteobacteria bacterium 65-7]
MGVAGSALGGALLGGGVSLLGMGITGAQIGGAIGALAGAALDSALTPGREIARTSPRLSDINIQASTEGAPVPRVFGRMRLAGQVIWASRYRETATTTKVSSGGKGGPSVTTSQTDYSYSISFAVGLCAGPATRLGRVWANGALLDLSQVTLRFHHGGEDQAADPLIAAIDGDVPGFRGLCYVVFEDLPLAAFGNRIPQLQFEVWRGLADTNPDSLENRLGAVALIPGAGEFVYADAPVFADDGYGGGTALNVHGAGGETDLIAALDDLAATAPNLGAVSLVVGWFGDDLRAGNIRIRPGVEDALKTTYPLEWSVNGVARAEAHAVSRIEDRPAYGGTPSDASIVQAIAALKARGLRVLFNPFLFMDVAADNALPDPATGAGHQPPYPWRGRITCLAADDGAPAAAAQVAHFFGTAQAGDFAVNGTTVQWTGGADWGWRRMVLHYAHLCAAAGGVDAFLIGSELRGLTQVRDGAAHYPAVDALKALAAAARAILGPGVKIGYGADWTEYGGHQTGDAPGAILFNLDPLWADTHIDFIGIDNYLPLSDWRDGAGHLDAGQAQAVTDATYLAANIRGGEGYDWYYASDADRAAQARTPITDGLGKPWVWRGKDLWNWWRHPHHDRPDGSENPTSTDWVPGSKPVWFTELGCPAINKGSNQPNVFVDPKSSESFMPYFSSGVRDDLIQRRFLEAHLNFWRDGANNPLSPVTGRPMLDTANIYAWCWDARPYPEFPALASVWGDAANYPVGHWLNGRLGAVALADLVAALCADCGFAEYDVSGLDGVVTGYAVTEPMSVRDALQPLAAAFFFDAVESGGVIRFVMRGRAALAAADEDDLALPERQARFTLARAQESDLPLASRITYIDGDQDYRQAVASAQRLVGGSNRIATSSLPLVMDQAQAGGIGARLLQDAWAMRERASFALPPSALALEPADEILLAVNGREHRLRVTAIEDGAARAVSAIATDPSLYDVYAGPTRAPVLSQTVTRAGRVKLLFLDLPWLAAGQNTAAPFLAAFADPWPGDVAVLRSVSDSGFALDAVLTRPASLGVTTQDFWSGPWRRWDRVNSLAVKLAHGALFSASEAAVLGGANALAVQNGDGGWEVLQFATATLTGPGEYRLTGLLRGRCGSEVQMRDPVAAGAAVVVLDSALAQAGLAAGEARQVFHYRWGPAARPIADVSWQGAVLAFEGVGQIPLAPCHVGFSWNGADLIIRWQRRDRDPSAASLRPVETAMSETRELYDLDILDGGGVKRRFSAVPQHAQVYTAAQQAADFPSGLPNPLTVHVYQLSALLGRGRRKQELL